MSLFQNIVNIVYRHPRAKYRMIMRFGGYLSYIKMMRGKYEMIKKSDELPPIISYNDGLDVYFLTGDAYIYQTLFCAYSLVKTSKEKFRFYLIDDGTFNNKIKSRLRTKMPNVTILDNIEILKNLNHTISKQDFPSLRNKRNVYPHIKKLTDVHTILNDKFKLVLDSDMLFFENPKDMIDWLKKPQGCLYLIDCQESYGYSNSLMRHLCNEEIPEKMNVGAVGFNTKDINWRDLDTWIDELEHEEGTTYFLEQALSAMIASKLSKTALQADKYIVNPKKFKEGDILHHYVDLSKKYYFEEAWKKIFNET